MLTTTRTPKPAAEKVTTPNPINFEEAARCFLYIRDTGDDFELFVNNMIGQRSLDTFWNIKELKERIEEIIKEETDIDDDALQKKWEKFVSKILPNVTNYVQTIINKKLVKLRKPVVAEIAEKNNSPAAAAADNQPAVVSSVFGGAPYKPFMGFLLSGPLEEARPGDL